MKIYLLSQIIKMSRYAIYGVCIQCLFLSLTVAKEGTAQNKSVDKIYLNVSFQQNKVETVLEKISLETDFDFIYNNNLLENMKKISLNNGNHSLGNVLRLISKKTGLQFKRINQDIMVSLRKSNQPKLIEIRDSEQSNVDILVSGKVTDENNQGLPGVSVLIKGTTMGTTTDFDGNYKLSVPEDASLSISFVGYMTQIIQVAGRSIIDVQMMADTRQLEEIIVIGYGTQNKKDVTGAIASVKGDVLNEVPVPSVEQSLSGRVAGVQVIGGSGVPGSGATIRVRGVGTLNNNEPLYVIDGIILGNVAGGGQRDVSPLSMINPNDIESVDVLKDASATAIYGARAGNGVVIITTKRGANKKMTINYEAYAAANVLDNSKYNQMSGPEWAGWYDKSQRATGFTDYTAQPFVDRILGGEEIPTYDWVDEITRQGKIQSHNLSVTGGNENSNYYTSLSYFDQTGVIHGSDLERITLRFNSDHKIGRKLKFGNTFLVARSVTNRQGNVDPNNNTNDYINRTLRTNVYKPIYRADGSYAGLDSHDPDAELFLDFENQHSIWDAKENVNLNSSNRIWASTYLDFEIIDGLVLHTMGSVDFTYSKNENYETFNDIEGNMLVLPERTGIALRQDEDRTWFIENTLTYNKTIHNDHDVTAMVGFQAQNFLGTFFSAVDGGFEDSDYRFFNRPHLQREVTDSDGNVILLLPEFTAGVNNGQAETGVNSYFGRLIYSYKGKYLLTATIRRDGSSKFGSERRWGTFPAVSAAWRISDEDFMSGSSWISDLKLRAGYGISGSDNVPNYQFASSVGQGGPFDYSFNGGEVSGATIARLANTFLRWEEIKMANVALDIGLMKGRINIVADFYNKTTSDLFLPYTPALVLGNEALPEGNLGEVNNKGIDLSISSVNLVGDLAWTTDLMFGFVKNEIIKLPENADRFASTNISRVGEEIGALYGFVVDGIFQNWDEVYDHAYQNQAVIEFDSDNNPVYDSDARDEITGISFTAPGDFRYKDLNGDGFIDSENDRQIIGSTIPDFTWGLTNTLTYKGIGLSVFFQGVHGVSVYNALKGTYQSRDLLDAWDGEGTSNSIPRQINTDSNGNGRTSAFQVENASYVRLKNLRVSYDLPQRLIGNIGMSRCQFYVTGTNLFTITDYTGYDPEVGLRSAGDNETAGIDRGQYPLTRQYTMGIKLTF